MTPIHQQGIYGGTWGHNVSCVFSLDPPLIPTIRSRCSLQSALSQWGEIGMGERVDQTAGPISSPGLASPTLNQVFIQAVAPHMGGVEAAWGKPNVPFPSLFTIEQHIIYREPWKRRAGIVCICVWGLEVFTPLLKRSRRWDLVEYDQLEFGQLLITLFLLLLLGLLSDQCRPCLHHLLPRHHCPVWSSCTYASLDRGVSRAHHFSCTPSSHQPVGGSIHQSSRASSRSICATVRFVALSLLLLLSVLFLVWECEMPVLRQSVSERRRQPANRSCQGALFAFWVWGETWQQFGHWQKGGFEGAQRTPRVPVSANTMGVVSTFCLVVCCIAGLTDSLPLAWGAPSAQGGRGQPQGSPHPPSIQDKDFSLPPWSRQRPASDHPAATSHPASAPLTTQASPPGPPAPHDDPHLDTQPPPHQRRTLQTGRPNRFVLHILKIPPHQLLTRSISRHVAWFSRRGPDFSQVAPH